VPASAPASPAPASPASAPGSGALLAASPPEQPYREAAEIDSAGDDTARFPTRMAVMVGAGTLLLFVGLYSAAFLYAGSGVPRGTSVLGVGIGGLSPAKASSKLEERLALKIAAPVELRISDRTLSLDPQSAGLSVDLPATVDAAAKRSLSPAVLIPRLFGIDRKVDPKTTADATALDSAVQRLAVEANQQVREGGLAFKAGQPVPIEPREGRTLDEPGAASVIRSGYLIGDQPLVLPAKITRPKATKAGMAEATSGFAKVAMSGPVTVQVGAITVPVEAQVIGNYLTLLPDGSGKLQPFLDGVGLKKLIGSRFASLEQKPKDVAFRTVGGKPTVVPSVPGREVSPAGLAKAIIGVLGKPSDRIAVVELTDAEPKLTAARAQQLGITEVVGTFKTKYPYAAYRLQNIHRAADLIRGNVIMPGQVWSLNRQVGERTAENGFARGFIIKDGRFAKDFGGGTSQVATTTFNAAFFAGLEIVEHKPHSFYISRYPEGREATVAWGSTDLKIRNNSGHAVYIDTAYTRGTVTVTMWGTKKWKIEATESKRYNGRAFKTVYDTSATCEQQDPVAGFDVDVWRIFKDLNGREVRREKFHTSYNPADNIICGPDPAAPPPTSTPPPTLPTAPPVDLPPL
jgi:vancomycin resistance protein YoaR